MKQEPMEEFVYEEEKYIKHDDLIYFEDRMMECDFLPEEIEDENEFGIIFQYLVNLTEKAPDFLQPYEYSLRMIELLEQDKGLQALQVDLERRWIEACDRIAIKEDIFNKEVPWGWQENRPLIRGLYTKANLMWKKGEFEYANEHFSKIFKTNVNDNIGARYSVRATAEKIPYIEFESRFTIISEDGSSYYNSDKLFEWFGEE